MHKGRCHCGAIQYEMPAEVLYNTLCHCVDCRRHSGSPMVGWAMVPVEQVSIEGEPRIYQSSEYGRRHFCGNCGTGLFYVNEVALPGMIDIQTGTLDDPDALPARAHVQVADRISWMATAHELPMFERFPSGP